MERKQLPILSQTHMKRNWVLRLITMEVPPVSYFPHRVSLKPPLFLFHKFCYYFSANQQGCVWWHSFYVGDSLLSSLEGVLLHRFLPTLAYFSRFSIGSKITTLWILVFHGEVSHVKLYINSKEFNSFPCSMQD